MKPRNDCPCHSGKRYAECCAPFHRGEREAPTAEALMRSRFSAFALGLGEYLARTMDEEADPADLSRAKDRQRFLDLKILHADETTVLFYARIFERGVNRSFAELSTFRRENGAWKYASGIAVPHERLPEDLEGLTPARLLELAR